MTIVRPRSQILTIWRVLLTIAAALPALAISFFLKGTPYNIAFFVWFILYLGVFLFYLPVLYSSLVYILDKGSVTLRRGVFYSNVYTIPLDSIQFTNIVITPISRPFGLVTLQVIAAGARVSIPGMSLKEARSFNKAIASLKEAQSE